MVRRNLAEGMIYRKALVGRTVTPLQLDQISRKERATTP